MLQTILLILSASAVLAQDTLTTCVHQYGHFYLNNRCVCEVFGPFQLEKISDIMNLFEDSIKCIFAESKQCQTEHEDSSLALVAAKKVLGFAKGLDHLARLTEALKIAKVDKKLQRQTAERLELAGVSPDPDPSKLTLKDIPEAVCCLTTFAVGVEQVQNQEKSLYKHMQDLNTCLTSVPGMPEELKDTYQHKVDRMNGPLMLMQQYPGWEPMSDC